MVIIPKELEPSKCKVRPFTPSQRPRTILLCASRRVDRSCREGPQDLCKLSVKLGRTA